ncbi:hypothetical protein NKR19_g8378 [Coniochaeta hoffmannii]|uniref:Uncharacterized protein n=1 Tax=Coniochaeta hoffmannii TaxID=91930 RepID=A0AA38VC88_9PEZI|nr:hypothetical protein NKR19_g8378 [Coniochaeta hoffmannii]
MPAQPAKQPPSRASTPATRTRADHPASERRATPYRSRRVAVMAAEASKQHSRLTPDYHVGSTADADSDSPLDLKSKCSSRAQLAEALEAVKNARTMSSTETLRSAWRALIARWSLTPGPCHFSVFARQNLDDACIVACLRAEFGPERVDSDYYKKSATSNVIKLAGLLRLSDPRLLALWFGVDDVRTPTRDTFSTILDYLQDLGVPSEDKAQAFSEWDYPDMVVKWAERARLDTSHPKDLRTGSSASRQPWLIRFVSIPVGNYPESRQVSATSYLCLSLHFYIRGTLAGTRPSHRGTLFCHLNGTDRRALRRGLGDRLTATPVRAFSPTQRSNTGVG